ncbi:hypothetical protein K4F52_008585 [Lecanicillium sp. MT-2017a]|nr:hypothetical protein K4F52_008585 [Lecanicillium sp. MT-2017a]
MWVSDHGYGSFLNDTIWVGGEVFPNMRFGYVEGHSFSGTLDQQIVPIFGLGALCITRECNTTETFIQGLYGRGIISRRAFSLYLGPNDPDATGTLLIGGVDKAKRQGAIYKRKMRDPTTDGALSQPNQIEVRAYSLVKSNGTRFDFAYPQETALCHLWDSGSPRWYMPEELFWEVAAYFGLPNTVDPAEAHYKVDCAYRQPTEDVLVVSMIDGADIPIAMHSLVTKVGDRCSIDVGGWLELWVTRSYGAST